MDEYKQQLEDIAEIRAMMEASTRFVSLSGLSGVSAGIVALLGAFGTYWYLVKENIYNNLQPNYSYRVSTEQLLMLIGIALLILLFAVGTAAFFTYRNSKRKGQSLLGKPGRRMTFNLAFPIVAGAIFCIEMGFWGYWGFVAPATLIFYGMGLFNAGKYTYGEIRYLGMLEIGLGLVAAALPGFSIWFWAVGFGVLHIVYGVLMYLRHER